MPLVSVIIPTYNRATLVTRAIGSVLAQTFTDYELIVVDDGSEDSTLESVASFESEVTVLTQRNRGVSAARNLGIERSRGDLVSFLDSDDEWLPGKLDCQVARFQRDKRFHISHTDEIWRRDGREIVQKKIHRKQGGGFFERALERCLISPSSVMISRELLNKVGWFDEDLAAGEDYDLWLRITAFHEVDFIATPLVIKHGGHRDQLSRCVPAIDRFRIQAIVKILSNPDLRTDHRQAAVAELTRKCRIMIAGCEKRGKIEEVEIYRELAESYQVDPS